MQGQASARESSAFGGEAGRSCDESAICEYLIIHPDLSGSGDLCLKAIWRERG